MNFSWCWRAALDLIAGRVFENPDLRPGNPTWPSIICPKNLLKMKTVFANLKNKFALQSCSLLGKVKVLPSKFVHRSKYLTSYFLFQTPSFDIVIKKQNVGTLHRRITRENCLRLLQCTSKRIHILRMSDRPIQCFWMIWHIPLPIGAFSRLQNFNFSSGSNPI